MVSYITIASTGNAIDFGDLTQSREMTAMTANTTRAVRCGGQSPETNVMDYATIATTGNFTDFGDLTDGLAAMYGTSGDHGGLQ